VEKSEAQQTKLRRVTKPALQRQLQAVGKRATEIGRLRFRLLQQASTDGALRRLRAYTQVRLCWTLSLHCNTNGCAPIRRCLHCNTLTAAPPRTCASTARSLTVL
jgi:hypothetical protein